MIISVYQKEQEVLVQTVAVTQALETILFFCPYCSYQIVQIQGTVKKITPGLTPTDAVVVLNKCPRCNMRYTFQHSTYPDGSRTKVTLTRYHNDEHTFRCYICRTPLIRFEHTDLFLLPTYTKVVLPVAVICPKSYTCPAKYFVVDIL